jgi:putative DNA primase/helicase
MTDNIVRLADLQDAGELPVNSEDALALAYAERHAADSRYVAAWGRWLIYDGARWSFDTTLHAFDRARAICREVALECDRPAAVAAARTVAAVVQLARADRRLAATAEQWDANHMQLVTAGNDGKGFAAIDTPAAAYDLFTGLARAPEPLDYMTRATACSAAPARTPHPQWSAFLDRITAGDVDMQSFLQRYIGYCCTGLTTEHAFVFAYGTGANGKSTFINTIVRIFGDYAAVADMGTFIASNTERHPTDLAKLRGARLVVSQETQKGRHWDETKIKALTGGDRLTARFLRQDFFDFVPTFKLFIAGNHKPRIGSVDEAMRRRLLLAPFTVRIPPGDRDPDLAEKLWRERAAILRWCLDGCLQWQRDGLTPPACVRDATDEYFRGQDTVGEWLEDCTEDGGDLAFTRMTALFASWKAWCEERNNKPGSTMALSGMLEDRSYAKRREAHTGQRGFARISLKKQ